MTSHSTFDSKKPDADKFSSDELSNDDAISSTVSSKRSTVCVLVGHSIEAITSAVVLASLGQTVHLYSNIEVLDEKLQRYGFERHLQALWQMYIQNKQIVSLALPETALALVGYYEQVKEIVHVQAELYWLFLDSVESLWIDEELITAFNHSHQQTRPIIMSGIEPLGRVAHLSEQLQRAWIYYIPFVFLQDGNVYSSMLTPSLLLLGEKTSGSSQRLQILQPLMEHAHAYHNDDIATVEFARSSTVAMLATRVSFMNEMSRLADSHHIDIQKVSHIMGLDERVGSSYLKAGWGFGGYTLPNELEKLHQSSVEHRVDMPLLESVSRINKDQKELIFRKFWQYFDGFIDNKAVMIWGSTYRVGSGLTSGSAIHPLLALLWSYNIRTIVYCNKVRLELTRLYGQQPLLQLVDEPYEQMAETQALFIVSWPSGNYLDTNQINQTAQPIFDAQNALTRSQISSLVGDYIGIGRAK